MNFGLPNIIFSLQKPGDHPNFRKNALHSRSLQESSGVFYSWSSSWNAETDSRNTKIHSRNGISRLEQHESHNSRSNSFAPAFSELFFKNLGGLRAPEVRIPIFGQ